MTDYEYYKDKYNLQLEYFAKFPVWTLDQIEYYLHIRHEMLQKLVNLKLLYKFKIGRLSFYSRYNRQYTNQSILKSMLRIDSYFRVHYSDIDGFVFDNSLDDKSLISRHVEKIGYVSAGDCKCNYYNVYSIYPYFTPRQYKMLKKLFLDIYALSGSDYIVVSVICYDTFTDTLESFLLNDLDLVPYYMNNFIQYKIVNVDYPHFKTLSNNM